MFWLWSCDPFVGIQTYQAEVCGIWHPNNRLLRQLHGLPHRCTTRSPVGKARSTGEGRWGNHCFSRVVLWSSCHDHVIHIASEIASVLIVDGYWEYWLKLIERFQNRSVCTYRMKHKKLTSNSRHVAYGCECFVSEREGMWLKTLAR